MKNILFALLCGLSVSWGDLGNGTYRNPVLAADFSDPDVIRVGEKYYMTASDFHFMGMQMLESDDMVNWRYVSRIFDRLDFPEYEEMKRYGGGTWAPALRYHNGEFFVYVCSPDEGLFMTKAAAPEGPWSPMLLVKKVAKWEDPCPFWDEDGQAYLGHSLYGASPIIIHKMSADGTQLLDDGVEVYRGPVAEGTKIHKWFGKYYMSIPEGGVRSGWQTILRSESIYGPWERKVVLETGTTKINGPHQGSIVDTPDGQWWFYHFQETDAAGRVLHLQPMRWSEDGWPMIGVDYDGNGVGEPVETWQKPLKNDSGSRLKQVGESFKTSRGDVLNVSGKRFLATFDDFNSQTLGLQWQWNHNPVNESWSLSEHPGSLTLHALPATSFKTARNTLTQKAVGWQSVITTSLSLEEMADGQRAGLVCMGKSNYMLGAMQKDGMRYLYLASDTTYKDATGNSITIENDPQILMELPIEFQHRSKMSSATEKNYEGYDIAPQNGEPIHPLYLRLHLDFLQKRFLFEYSLDGLNFVKAGEEFYTRWGNWKGVRPGLYTYSLTPLTPSPNKARESKMKGTAKKAYLGAVSFFNFDVCAGSASISVTPYEAQRSVGAMWEEEERIVSNIAQTSFPNREIIIKEGGRSEIQAAIDSISYLGGGTVRITAGTYLLPGNLVMKSNVNLHLEKGATLMFSGIADDFLPTVFTRWEGTELFGHSPMIYALHAQNIAITGEGVIDAQAGNEMGKWNVNEKEDQNRLREQGETLAPLSERVYGKGTILRPTCIEFVGCSRVLVEGITIKDSPFWTIHPLYCDNVIVRGVTIDTHFPNNDGCDPESSSNVLIENCVFNVGDDAVAIKSGRDADGRRVGRPSENIVIRNCLFNSECNGLCIGSEMSGGAQNIFMHDIQIGTVKNAIYFKSNRDRGGYVRNVHVSDITVHHALGAVLRFETNYFGFRGGQHASQYEDFHIRNIDAKKSDHYALFISGYPEKPVRNVLIENMSVQDANEPYYLHCTESVLLKNVRVNGKAVPETPENEEKEITLSVF